jgi:hypothetical protein
MGQATQKAQRREDRDQQEGQDGNEIRRIPGTSVQGQQQNQRKADCQNCNQDPTAPLLRGVHGEDSPAKQYSRKTPPQKEAPLGESNSTSLNLFALKLCHHERSEGYAVVSLLCGEIWRSRDVEPTPLCRK